MAPYLSRNDENRTPLNRQCPNLEGHVYPPLAAPKATRALSWPHFANGRACATKRYGARRRDGARPSKLQIRTLPLNLTFSPSDGAKGGNW